MTVLPAPDEYPAAVLAFTAHSVVAAAVSRDDVLANLDTDDLGAALKAPFLTWLGERVGAEPGNHDAVFVATGTGAGAALEEVASSEHPRVVRALSYRSGVRVFAEESGVLTIARGLAGRWEMSFEIDDAARGRGAGRRLACASVGLVPAGEPVFAQVAPGNAASMRAVYAAGFRPVGAEVLFMSYR